MELFSIGFTILLLLISIGCFVGAGIFFVIGGYNVSTPMFALSIIGTAFLSMGIIVVSDDTTYQTKQGEQIQLSLTKIEMVGTDTTKTYKVTLIK
jgi:hypothetical protein